MYGNTMKPSFTNSSAAFKVSIASGIKYFGLGGISSFSQLVSKASRANWAANTASLALRTPDVFGNKLNCGCDRCFKISSLSLVTSTRFKATVTNSEPDASNASSIKAEEENLPVPVNKRELNVLPAITN